jgi:hypothetical protein
MMRTTLETMIFLVPNRRLHCPGLTIALVLGNLLKWMGDQLAQGPEVLVNTASEIPMPMLRGCWQCNKQEV